MQKFCYQYLINQGFLWSTTQNFLQISTDTLAFEIHSPCLCCQSLSPKPTGYRLRFCCPCSILNCILDTPSNLAVFLHLAFTLAILPHPTEKFSSSSLLTEVQIKIPLSESWCLAVNKLLNQCVIIVIMINVPNLTLSIMKHYRVIQSSVITVHNIYDVH